jgi:hypothetical protein
VDELQPSKDVTVGKRTPASSGKWENCSMPEKFVSGSGIVAAAVLGSADLMKRVIRFFLKGKIRFLGLAKAYSERTKPELCVP